MEATERRRRVVIAEDDEEMRAVMVELVSTLDVDVATAASGSELIMLLTDDSPVDLVITDVRMPWMTGYQVALSARNSGLRLPIIVVTAFPDETLRASVEKLGSAVLLAKPFQPEELLTLARANLSAQA
jgi:CheY-like chemotaxis protein